jgi:D-alanyl-lipoteichoic acid acyltransferase DltB (MBOAT superfamily)
MVSFIDFFRMIGIPMNVHSMQLIVPLGISFLTFIAISYLVDIYRNQLQPEKNITNLTLSLIFFPIILAGPIQRPSTLLPQIRKPRKFEFEQASDGLRQILWGLFVKMVVADNLASIVNVIFPEKGRFNGITLALGAIMFSIQIYADFSAYSNMAIGTARLLGFNLMQNFRYPYFASNIADFWKRWHISLTTWFRDYIFLPLSYVISRRIKPERVLFVKTEMIIYSSGIFITWLLTGFWHGAKWTFLLWGMIHAVFLILHHALRKPRKRLLAVKGFHTGIIVIVVERTSMLVIVVISMIFFRVNLVYGGWRYITLMGKKPFLTLPEEIPLKMIIPVFILFFVEWIQRDKLHGLDFTGSTKPIVFRWSVYLVLLILILLFKNNPQQFYYFRF